MRRFLNFILIFALCMTSSCQKEEVSRTLIYRDAFGLDTKVVMLDADGAPGTAILKGALSDVRFDMRGESASEFSIRTARLDEEGKYLVTVSASANTGPERSIDVTAYNGKCSCTFTVTQKGR